MLNRAQKDLLTELVNTYIGQAASLLSEMVNQKIILSIPLVELLSVSDISMDSYRCSGILTPGHVISSSIRFGHEFQGKAFLVFPVEQAKVLVSACMGEMAPEADRESIQLMDTDFDVMKEIGNVLLNAIIGEFGNLFETKLEYSLPEIELVFVSETHQRVLLQNEIYILVLHTSFLLSEAKVEGKVIIALSMNSISQLLKKIDALLEDVYA